MTRVRMLCSHILHLVFSLVGTLETGAGCGGNVSLPNRAAFEDLLCDLEIWREAPNSLLRSLLEHLLELMTENPERLRLGQELDFIVALVTATPRRWFFDGIRFGEQRGGVTVFGSGQYIARGNSGVVARAWKARSTSVEVWPVSRLDAASEL